MLTDTEIKKLKATGKDYQKADPGGWFWLSEQGQVLAL